MNWKQGCLCHKVENGMKLEIREVPYLYVNGRAVEMAQYPRTDPGWIPGCVCYAEEGERRITIEKRYIWSCDEEKTCYPVPSLEECKEQAEKRFNTFTWVKGPALIASIHGNVYEIYEDARIGAALFINGVQALERKENVAEVETCTQRIMPFLQFKEGPVLTTKVDGIRYEISKDSAGLYRWTDDVSRKRAYKSLWECQHRIETYILEASKR